MQISVVQTEQGLRITPAGCAPRLERAFTASAGRGMLDLLRYGLPVGAAPALAWLRERARERMMAYLRALRRGEVPQSALCVSGAALVRLFDSLPPIEGLPIAVSDVVAWLESLHPAVEWLAAKECCSAEEWLSRLGEGWQQLGMLCFHLAENAGDAAQESPFAFLATFVHKVGQDGRAKHAPLGMAARLLAGDSPALLALLRPLKQVAAQDEFLAELINSQAVYKPCGWAPRQTYRFLEAMPLLESAGIETRMVNLWKNRPPRVELEVQLDTVEGGAGSGKSDASPSVNINSLLYFYPRVVLGDYQLTDEELQQLLAMDDDGLVRFRGEWIRLDAEKLQKLINGGKIQANQRTAWESIGLAFGTILENEMDGMKWVSVIDGRKEYAALQFGNLLIDPASLVWNKVKAKEACDLKAEFARIKEEVETRL